MAQPVTVLLCCAAIIGLSVNQIKWNMENSDIELLSNSSNDSDTQGQLSIGDLFRAKNCSAINLINLSNGHTEGENSNRSQINVTNCQGQNINSANWTDEASNEQSSHQPQQRNITYYADDFFEYYLPVDSQNRDRNCSQFRNESNDSHNETANASNQAVGRSNSSYGYEDSWQSDRPINNSSSQVNNSTQGAHIHETNNSRNSASGNRSSSSGGENGSYAESWEQQSSNSSANQYSQESGDWSSYFGRQNVSQFRGQMNASHNGKANASNQVVGRSNSSYGYENSRQSDRPINNSSSQANNATAGAPVHETNNSTNSASGNRSSSSGGENGSYSESGKHPASNSSANLYSRGSGNWNSHNGRRNVTQFRGQIDGSQNKTANASNQVVGRSNSSYGYGDSRQSDRPINNSSSQVNNATAGAPVHETNNSTNSASGNRSSSSDRENGSYSESWQQETSNFSANEYSQESGNWNSHDISRYVKQYIEMMNEFPNETANAPNQELGGSNSSYGHEDSWQSDQPKNDSSSQVNNATRGGPIHKTDNSTNSASGNRKTSSGGENGSYSESWEQRSSNSSANQYSQESGDWSFYFGSRNVSQFRGQMNASHNEKANASNNQALGRSNFSSGREDGWQSHSAANDSADNVVIWSRHAFSNEEENKVDHSSSGSAGNSSSQLDVQCKGEVDNPTRIIDVSRSQRLFALRLYKAIRERAPANLAVSTANTFFSLAEISYGAAEQTRAELQSALQLPSLYCYDPLDGYENSMGRIQTINTTGVALAHGIFLSREYEVSSQFRRIVTSSFHSKINRLTNRGSAAKWFTKNGNPLEMLLSRFVGAENIHGNESIILVNAAYIKGSWLNKFHRCTENILIDGGSVYGVSESPSMQSVGKFNYGQLPDVNASFLEIPLADVGNPGHGAIFIILPNEAHGITKLESEINEATIGRQIFNGSRETVNVILPEFIIESHSNLVETLREMNLNKMFNDEADFNNITVSGPAKVDLVLHKIVIHGRSTGDSISCAPNATVDVSDNATIQFKADHPFLIVVAIRDENPIILSIARFAVANDNF